MKYLISLCLILFISTNAFCASEAWKLENMTIVPNNKFEFVSSSEYAAVFKIEPINQISFSNETDEVFLISWENCTIDFKLQEGCTMTEAARLFFDAFKVYFKECCNEK